MGPEYGRLMVLGRSVARSSSATMQTSHIPIPVFTGPTSSGNQATLSVCVYVCVRYTVQRLTQQKLGGHYQYQRWKSFLTFLG